MATLPAVLTDGSGIGTFTASKVFKDFVVDFLTSIPVSLGAAGIVGVPSDKIALLAGSIGVGGALVGALYRAVLKWASS